MEMKKTLMVLMFAGSISLISFGEAKPAAIKLRDVDLKGTMSIADNLSLTATFDVQKEDLFDELVLDFYILMEPDDEDRGLQFFHCRTIHRFLSEETGYTSGVVLPSRIMECIDPDKCEYAVVLTYKGEEVGLENSLKERWWENKELGRPIENVLIRSTQIPTVRPWESS